MDIYTDGSKTGNGTSAAFYVRKLDVKHVIKIKQYSSIFSAELFAILKSLYWISGKRYTKNLIITDSLSSLQAFNTQSYGKNVLLNKILILYSFLIKSGLTVNFLWIPSHSGIPGNEFVDKLAKLETGSPPTPNRLSDNITRKQAICPISTSEFKSLIRTHVNLLWDEFTNARPMVPLTKLIIRQYFPKVCLRHQLLFV